MRKEVPEIGWGEFEVLKTGDSAVLAIRYDWRNNSVLFVHNLAAEPREISVSVGVSAEESQVLVNLLSEEHSQADRGGPSSNDARSLRISLVSSGRLGLPAQAQRYREPASP